MNFIMTNRWRFFYLSIVLLMGVIINIPELDFQSGIAQGDHGRELYAFKAVIDGERPYRDFWWPYGPLMPYYYSVFLKCLGVSIQSVMAGRMLLILLSGIFFFLALSCFIPILPASVGTVWFFLFNPHFTHTYNHVGAVSLMPIVIYLLFLYIKAPHIKYLYIGLTIIFIVSIVKLNIGLSTLVAFTASVLFIDFFQKISVTTGKKYFYFISSVLLPLCVFTVYFFSLKGLPPYYLHQCFPYIDIYHFSSQVLPKSHVTLGEMLKNFVLSTVHEMGGQSEYGGVYQFFAAVTGVCLLGVARFMLTNEPERRRILLVAGVLCLFIILNSHEFFGSGVYYRIFWITPFLLLFAFFVIGKATRTFGRRFKFLIFFSLLFICHSIHTGRCNWKNFVKASPYQQYFTFSQGNFYSQNHPEWFRTIKRAVRFLNGRLKPEETFFALPYEPLYFFLMDRKDPVLGVPLFEYMHITEEQEQGMIGRLEDGKIEYILISNRSISKESGMGVFGKTHCVLLSRYIQENFETVATFGEWEKEPGYMWNHGVQIVKRRVIDQPKQGGGGHGQ